MSEKVISGFENDVYKKYYPLVFSNCKRRLAESSSIDDAVQSTFLMYIREEESINSPLSSWLYWTSTNVCKVLNKGVKMQKIIADREIQNSSLMKEDSAAIDKETQAQLKNLLETLPKKKQEMLLMRFFDEMSYRQIALHFKSTEDGVRKMIEHTLDHLKDNIKKKDIVFSVLFIQFFEKNSFPDMAVSTVATKAPVFILQNTAKQQLIIQGVHKMVLYSKLKFSSVLCACILLPVSALVFAGNTNSAYELEQNNAISKAEKSNNPIKPTVVKEEAPIKKAVATSEPIPEVKAVDPIPEVPKVISPIGVWKLKSKTANYPHQVGSILTIKKDGTFTLTQPNAVGTYIIKDTLFTFNFSGFMIFEFNYKIEEEKLSFDLNSKTGKMQMEYVKAEK